MASRALITLGREAWVVNPFRLLFMLYLFANLYAFVTLLIGWPISVDSEELTFRVETVLLAALALFASLFACVFAFRAAARITRRGAEMTFEKSSACVLLAIQSAFIAYNLYYGANIAGVEDDFQGNNVLRLFFSVSQPDLLFLIVGVGMKSRRMFFTNALVYSISLLLRSWIGGLYLLAVVVAVREYPLRLDRRIAKRLAIILLVGMLALPIIVSGKWFIRSGASVNDALDFLSDIGYETYLLSSIGYVANRFQHLGHVSLILESAGALNEAYEAGRFIPYWMDAAPQWLILRLFGIDIVTLNKYMVQSLFDSNNLAYASNPGLAGWLFVLQGKAVFMALYLPIVTLLPAILVRRFAGQKYFLFMACFSLIYLFHGWVGAYANLVIYLLAFIFFKQILGHRASARDRILTSPNAIFAAPLLQPSSIADHVTGPR